MLGFLNSLFKKEKTTGCCGGAVKKEGEKKEGCCSGEKETKKTGGCGCAH